MDVAEVGTGRDGLRNPEGWMSSFAVIGRVAVEGTSSYGGGGGLAVILWKCRVGVGRPAHQQLCQQTNQSKSDPTHAVGRPRRLSPAKDLCPKARDGIVEAVPMLAVTERLGSPQALQVSPRDI